MAEVELQQIGSYTISQLLSKSPTSNVYLGKQPRKKDVLIKVLRTPLEIIEAKEAFLSRAKQLKKLKHRNIVEVREFGILQDGGKQQDCGYLVMEYVAGKTLREHFPQGESIPPLEAKQILSPIADALHYAHVSNVLHSNLHPGNLLLGTYKDTLLTGFSLTQQEISLVLDDEESAIPYMAPESLHGTPTAASDQYALAVMVYEWLCGRRPYEATTREQLLYQQEHDQFPPPRSLNETISPALESVLLRALARAPEQRFLHTLAFADAYLRTLMGLPLKLETRPITPSISLPSSENALGKGNMVKKEAAEESAIHPAPKTENMNDRNGATQITESTLSAPTLENESQKNSVKSEAHNKHTLLNQRYRILEQVGKGSMGTVYKAEDTQLDGRPVAVKEMIPDGISSLKIDEITNKFQHEAYLLARLNHPNLPSIHDYFSDMNRWYLVMAFIEGETLENYLGKTIGGRLQVEEVIEIGIHLCNVLDYLHSQQPPIIFRDLKPSNIMLTSDKRIYLIDFGIARLFKPDSTKDTASLGTPGYAPLEQYGKNAKTTPRSDIYSLGATLHHLISGHNPSQNPFYFAPLQLGNQTNLFELEVLIMRMLDKDESKRPTSIVVKQELQQIAAQISSIHASTVDNETVSRAKSSKPNVLIEYDSLHDIVSADLCQGGVLSESLPGYEERPAQIEMATFVTRSLTESVPAIVEAGTGTGKSLAYLVPIVRSSKVAIISTANKALQEQLFYKDIPFVQQHIKHFEAALVKGVANYVCLDRLDTERNGLQYYAKNRDFVRLLNIVDDPESTFMGDLETLSFQLPGEIRSRVATDSDQCAWNKCNFYEDCYVRKMREKALDAQVIVVNHTLLLLDAAIGGFLLPARDVIVLDEAHHLEEEATRSFTVTISPTQITTLLSLRMLKDHSQVSLQDETNTALAKAWMRLEQVADPGYKGRANLQSPLEEGLKLASIITELADSLRKHRPKDLPEKESLLYDKLLKRTQNLSQNIRTVFSVDQPSKFVYYVERVNTPGRGYQLQVSAAPLDVTTWLRERLFDKCNVICTSATLATVGPNPVRPEEKGPNFAYFRRRIGLDPVERPDVLERILPLSFDYESNALLYLPRDLPEPVYGAGSEDYTKAIAREMYKLVKVSRGRAFLLFSSKRMLDGAYELMSPHLNFPLLRQGDLPRIELTRRFREETGAILFGLKSFWEGVDIAGEALSLVVIDKLPFDPPDDPVHEARVVQMKAAGENWFGTYVLPQAVLRLKQGLGRLLRTREDRGVMAILDTRLHTKGYGKLVLDALPPARRTSSIKEVERFFF